MRPTSAWNLSGENTQVATPIASVMPVKKIAAPVTCSAAEVRVVHVVAAVQVLLHAGEE